MAKGGTIAWVETNVGTKRQADRLVAGVMQARLAACANRWPVESVYWWKGKLEHAREVAVLFKTDPRRLRALVAAVRRAHPYAVPYLAWGRGTAVTPPYARWAAGETAARRTRRAPGRRGRARPRTR